MSEIELTEEQINSYPAGRDLDMLVEKYVFLNSVTEHAGHYSTNDRVSEWIIDNLVTHKFLYGIREEYNRGYSVEADAPMQHIVIGYDGIANPWGWGDTKAIARCRFGLKAMLYKQRNREKASHDGV